MLNNHVNCEFINLKKKQKKQRFVSYDAICMPYITMFILTKQIYLNFDQCI